MFKSIPRRGMRRFTGTASCGVMLLAAACSSSGSGSGGSANKQEVTQCVQSATPLADKAKAPVPLLLPQTPIDFSSHRGQKVWLVSVVQNENSQAVANGFAAAAKTVGLTSRYVVGGGNPSDQNKVIHEAVSSHAAGIVLFNIRPDDVSESLRDAVAAKVPVVDYNDGEPTDPLKHGVYAHVTSDFTAQGRAVADWMLAESKCDMTLGTFNYPAAPVINDSIKGATAEMKRLCSWCAVHASNFDLSSLGTTLGPLAVSVAHRFTATNYMYPAFDGFVSVMSPSLQSAGWKGKLVGHDGTPSTLAAIRAHSTLQAMTEAVAPAGWQGWVLVDELGHAMNHMALAKWVLPARVVDSSNIGANDAAVWSEYQGFEAKFRQAWGVG